MSFKNSQAVPASSHNKSYVYAHQLSVKDFQPKTIEEDDEDLHRESATYSERASSQNDEYFMMDNGSRSGSI